MKVEAIFGATAMVLITSGCSEQQGAVSQLIAEEPTLTTIAQKTPAELTMADYEALEEEAFKGDYQA